jgi:ribonuclease G
MTEGRELRIGFGPGETRLGLFQGERALALRVLRQGWPHLGSVHRGRVLALLKGLGAALVDTGHARAGYLEAKGLSEGQMVAVRVMAEPWSEKGAKLALSGEAALAQPALEPVASFLEAHPGIKRVTADDRGYLALLRQSLPGWADRLEFAAAEGLDEAIEAALSRVVSLPSGGRLVIERTAALTAIDVDTGSDLAALARNRASAEAAQEIACQIRLRELAGRILVDFAGLKRKPLNLAVESLRQALEAAGLAVQMGGVTPLGLVELVRERRFSPLADLLLAPRPEAGWNAETAALAGLRAALREIAANPSSRPRLSLGKEAAAWLSGKHAKAREETERRLGHLLEIIVTDRDDWEIVT